MLTYAHVCDVSRSVPEKLRVDSDKLRSADQVP